MNRIWTTELSRCSGQRVRLAGWLHRLRRLSNVSFLLLRDARGVAQVVLEDQDAIERLAALHNESTLAVEATVVANPQAPGGFELHGPTIEVLSEAAAPPPFDLFRPALNVPLTTLLDYAPLSLRHPKRRDLFRLSAAAQAGFRSTLSAMGFVEVHSPKLVGAATEGGANLFAVDYFGRPAFLAQSPQLYKQILVGVFERVFEIGPAFRAEPHDTPRHINEFISLDVEIGFIEDLTTVMALLTRVLRGMIEAIGGEAQATGMTLALPRLPESIPAIHFVDALDRVSRALGEDVRSEPDLAPAHERCLGDWAASELDSDFLFVTGYPAAKRAFYTHPDPNRPGYTNSFDLLFRGVELVSGGQRLHRYEDYLVVLEARGMDPAGFAGYLDAFKYGMPPHGGFAIGLERLLAQLLEVPNVREVTLFPRDLHRLTP